MTTIFVTKLNLHTNTNLFPKPFFPKLLQGEPMIKRNLLITLFILVIVTMTTIGCGRSTTADKTPNAPEPVETKVQTDQVNSAALPPDEKEVQKIDEYTKEVYSILFSPDGKTILTISNDTATIWDAVTRKEVKKFEGYISDLSSSVVFSPNGKTVLTAGRSLDNTVTIWDATTGKKVQKFEGHTRDISSAVFSPNGKTVLTTSHDETARIWDVVTGEELVIVYDVQTLLQKKIASFSPDGKTILIGGVGKKLSATIVDVETQKRVELSSKDRLEKAILDNIYFATFFPRGKTIFLYSFGGFVSIWNVATAEVVQRFEFTDFSTPLSVHFAKDQPLIAVTKKEDEKTMLIAVVSTKEIQEFEGHTDAIESAVFSPDGKTVLTTSKDKTVRIWDVATGKELQKLEKFLRAAAAFSPDNKTVVISGGETVQFYDLNMIRQNLEQKE
jgi:WD40 repeat protein